MEDFNIKTLIFEIKYSYEKPFISSFDVPQPSDPTPVALSEPSSSVDSANNPNLPSAPDNTRDNTFLWLVLLALGAALVVLIYRIRNKKNKA